MIDQSLWRSSNPTDGSVPDSASGSVSESQNASSPATSFPREIDVAIIGAGITGLTAAYLLKQSGKRVAVFERERVGSGETGNTSAHLTMVTDLRLREMVSEFGEHAARLVWEGSARAIDQIETIVSEHHIECGFTRVPGFLCSPFFRDDDKTSQLEEDVTLARKLGFDAAFVANGPITGKPAESYADQALFHPLRYLAGLHGAVTGDGSFVFEMSEVSQVVEDPLAVVVNGETIACGDVIIATHVPISGATSLVSAMLRQSKIYPYSTYVLGARVESSTSSAGGSTTGDNANGTTARALAPGLYSDTADPYFYLRVHRDNEGLYAIFGGEDHKTGTETDTEACFQQLEQRFLQLIPSARIDRRWSGQVIETTDGLPYVGITAEHQYIATGYAGNGLTFGTLSAMMLRDTITGADNPLLKLFDPDRKASSVSAIGTYISESTAYPFYFIRDRLARHKQANADNVERGDGKVLTIEGKRVACHRTDDGQLLQVSAVCTHMGCLVRWNGAEKTWDCPCHGSRFTPDGLVIGGPAEKSLEPITAA